MYVERSGSVVECLTRDRRAAGSNLIGVTALWGPPGVLGILGEWLFIFRDLGSTGYYFRGAGEQAHSLGDLGSPPKKQKK